jgi:hypothetical protein
MKRTLIVAAGAVLAASFVTFGVTTPVAQGDSNYCLTLTGPAMTECMKWSQAYCGHAAGCDGDPICHSEISPDGSMPLCNSCRTAIGNPNPDPRLVQQVAFDCGGGSQGGVNTMGGKPHCMVGVVHTGRIPPACDGDLQANGDVTNMSQ